MLYVWIYLVFPIIGSLLAVIFYRFIYLKTKLQGKEVNDNNMDEETDKKVSENKSSVKKEELKEADE